MYSLNIYVNSCIFFIMHYVQYTLYMRRICKMYSVQMYNAILYRVLFLMEYKQRIFDTSLQPTIWWL